MCNFGIDKTLRYAFAFVNRIPTCKIHASLTTGSILYWRSFERHLHGVSYWVVKFFMLYGFYCLCGLSLCQVLLRNRQLLFISYVLLWFLQSDVTSIYWDFLALFILNMQRISELPYIFTLNCSSYRFALSLHPSSISLLHSKSAYNYTVLWIQIHKTHPFHRIQFGRPQYFTELQLFFCCWFSCLRVIWIWLICTHETTGATSISGAPVKKDNLKSDAQFTSCLHVELWWQAPTTHGEAVASLRISDKFGICTPLSFMFYVQGNKIIKQLWNYAVTCALRLKG